MTQDTQKKSQLTYDFIILFFELRDYTLWLLGQDFSKQVKTACSVREYVCGRVCGLLSVLQIQSLTCDLS